MLRWALVFRKCFIILFLNEFMKSSFLPKYESNVLRISPLYCEIVTIFGSYFGGNDDFINSF